MLGSCIEFIRYLDEYKKTLNTVLDFAKVVGKDVTSAQSTLNSLDLSGTEGCENSKRILQSVQPSKDLIFQWNMNESIDNITTAWRSWKAYVNIPQAESNQSVKMTEKCMQSAPFKRIWEKIMYGKLDNSAMYESIKPLFETIKSLDSLLSNQTARNKYSRLMGPNFASSFTNASVKSGPTARVGAKFGDSVYKNKRVGHRALQTVQVMPTIKSDTNGIDLQNYQNDVQDVPQELEASTDQQAPAYSNLLRVIAASFIVLISMIV